MGRQHLTHTHFTVDWLLTIEMSTIWELKIPKCRNLHERLVTQSSVVHTSVPGTLQLDHCVHCRQEHNDTIYCSRVRLNAASATMGRKSRPQPDLSSSSSEDTGGLSSSSSDSSESSNSNGEEQVTGLNGPPVKTAALDELYTMQKRPDSREVTCTINKATFNHYFKTIIHDGHLLKEGADKLRDKYYLDSRQYNHLSPPTLHQTKLHSIQRMKFCGLSGETLQHTQSAQDLEGCSEVVGGDHSQPPTMRWSMKVLSPQGEIKLDLPCETTWENLRSLR